MGFVSAAVVVTLAMGGIDIVTGANILNGANWARWFYTIGCACLLAADLIFMNEEFYLFVPVTVMRGIFIILMFLPAANEYFSPRMTRPRSRSSSAKRRS